MPTVAPTIDPTEPINESSWNESSWNSSFFSDFEVIANAGEYQLEESPYIANFVWKNNTSCDVAERFTAYVKANPGCTTDSDDVISYSLFLSDYSGYYLANYLQNSGVSSSYAHVNGTVGSALFLGEDCTGDMIEFYELNTTCMSDDVPSRQISFLSEDEYNDLYYCSQYTEDLSVCVSHALDFELFLEDYVAVNYFYDEAACEASDLAASMVFSTECFTEEDMYSSFSSMYNDSSNESMSNESSYFWGNNTYYTSSSYSSSSLESVQWCRVDGGSKAGLCFYVEPNCTGPVIYLSGFMALTTGDECSPDTSSENSSSFYSYLMYAKSTSSNESMSNESMYWNSSWWGNESSYEPSSNYSTWGNWTYATQMNTSWWNGSSWNESTWGNWTYDSNWTQWNTSWWNSSWWTSSSFSFEWNTGAHATNDMPDCDGNWTYYGMNGYICVVDATWSSSSSTTQAPTSTTTLSTQAPTTMSTTSTGSTQAPVSTWSVAVTSTLSDLTLDDWSDDVEELFIQGIADSFGVDSSRVNVISVTAGSVVVETEVTDFESLDDAETFVAVIEIVAIVLDEALGSVEIEVAAPQEIVPALSTSTDEPSSSQTDPDPTLVLDMAAQTQLTTAFMVVAVVATQF